MNEIAPQAGYQFRFRFKKVDFIYGLIRDRALGITVMLKTAKAGKIPFKNSLFTTLVPHTFDIHLFLIIIEFMMERP